MENLTEKIEGAFCPLDMESMEKSGYLAFLESIGYVALLFPDNRVIIFPLSALPQGCGDGDRIEFYLRRLEDEQKKPE